VFKRHQATLQTENLLPSALVSTENLPAHFPSEFLGRFLSLKPNTIMSRNIALAPTPDTGPAAHPSTAARPIRDRPSQSATRSAILGVICVSVLLGGCANMSNRSSSFLDNYGQLKSDPKDSHRLVYERAGWKKTDYTSVLMEPVVVRLSADDQKKITAQEMTDLAAYGDTALRKAFAKEWKIVTVAEPGTLLVRSAITGVDTSNPALNVATSLVLGPVDNGGVRMEFEVRDATNGAPLAALMGFSNGNPLQSLAYFSRFGHAHRGIDHWCLELRKITHPAERKTAAK
jgi:hypothetical protein